MPIKALPPYCTTCCQNWWSAISAGGWYERCGFLGLFKRWVICPDCNGTGLEQEMENAD